MAILAHEHHHWAFVWIPIFTAFIWAGTLVAMISSWAGLHKPHYASMSPGQHVPYISDIGASELKPLFVVGCCITGVGFVLCLLSERLLRHNGRLVQNMRRRESVFSWLAILGSLIGGAGLILLSIFDTLRHPSMHRGFLLMFMVGVALSAIFTIIEFRWISKDFGGATRLRRAYWMKGVIATILIALAIAFGITLYADSSRLQDVAGALEWTISLGYTFYLLTFWYDLHLSKGRHRGELSAERLMAERAGQGAYGNGNGYRPSTDTYGTHAPLRNGVA